ncbi:MAG: phosphatase PAP2 family protein [Bacteroidales bacterium]|nr:phosphatase PAP2 family protein [Bacteroidales bacterium]
MEVIDYLIQIDTNLFLFLNKYHNEFFDIIMSNISKKMIWLPLYIFVAFLLFKKYKLKTGLILLVFFGLLITVSDQTSVHLFKNVFQRLRPCYNPEIHESMHYLKLSGGHYGFVSSHAANAFAFASLSLLLLKNKLYSILIIFWAFIVSYSRIYLGVHYPGDIIGGALLGISISILIYIIIKKILKKEFN